MNRVYLSNQNPVKFKFKQTPHSFKVIENNNIRLIKKGEYRLIKVKKISISTMEMVEYLSSVLKIASSEIGYAGLKDKHATTIQYITVPKYVNIKKFKNSDRVHLNELGYCANRLRVGQLESNSFEIILGNVSKDEFSRVEKAFNKIVEFGFANFFGYQRFGVLDDSSQKGYKISQIGKGSKNQNSKILLAAYQARAFNNWLNRRLLLSKNIADSKNDEILYNFSPTLLNTLKDTKSIFKLLPGDLGYFYKRGKKCFKSVNDIIKYTNSFLYKKYHITGVLFGSSVRYSNSIAGNIERKFIDYSFNMLRGTRRDAWIWLKDAKINYIESNESVILFFTLPPGSYATILLEELLNKELINLY